MFDDLKCGARIRITITAAPRSRAARETIRRLRRLDTEAQRQHRLAKAKRARNTVCSTRAGRPWYLRPTIGWGKSPEAGDTWSMRFRPQIAADLGSVKQYINVEPE